MDNSKKNWNKFLGAMVVNLFIAYLLELAATELKLVIPSHIYGLAFFFLLSIYVIVFLVKTENKTGWVKLIPYILLAVLVINIYISVQTAKNPLGKWPGSYPQSERD